VAACPLLALSFTCPEAEALAVPSSLGAPVILSRYCVVTVPFLDQVDQIAKRVVFSTRKAQRRIVDVGTWERIGHGALDGLPVAVLRDLVESEILVPDEEDELAAILGRNRAAVEDEDILYVVVEPTAQCQLGCSYCGQEHTAHLLSEEDQDRLVHGTRRRLEQGSYRVLRVSWFGAEPLLGLSVLRTLVPRLLALAEEFRCNYGSLMITNGLTLSDTLATELVRDLRVREFQITLDGTAEFHDARRHTKNGTSGTFERIFANIGALARRDDLRAEVIVRCNVDRRNVQGVSPLIQALARAEVLRRLADFSVAPVHDWGNDAGKYALPPEEFARLELQWLAELISLGFTPPRLIPRRRPVNCMALRPTAVLVDPFGNLYNCTEASLVPTPSPAGKAVPAHPGLTTAPYSLPLVSTAETFRIGDLKTGEQAGRRRALGDFNERVARGEYPCHSCRMLPVCGGGCPKHWLEGTPGCPSAKYNIEGRLLLSYALSRLPTTVPG
jgi:uncharacterized protein